MLPTDRLAHRPPIRILVATEGSPMAVMASRLVAAAAPRDAEVRVAAVASTGTELFGGPWPALAAVQADKVEVALERYLEGIVATAADRIRATGRSVSTTVIRGRPAREIVAEAGRWAADLVVVGSRGHSTIANLILGSVSAEVVDRSPVPVLVARGERLRRVVVATDGSERAAEGIRFVATSPLFAGLSCRTVSVVPALPPWWAGMMATDVETVGEGLDAMHQLRLAAELAAGTAANRLTAAGRPAEPVVTVADAAGGILTATEDFDADLVVVATRGQTGLRRLVLGSVARNVLGHAACSVLVVRPPRTRIAVPAAGAQPLAGLVASG